MTNNQLEQWLQFLLLFTLQCPLKPLFSTGIRMAPLLPTLFNVPIYFICRVSRLICHRLHSTFHPISGLILFLLRVKFTLCGTQSYALWQKHSHESSTTEPQRTSAYPKIILCSPFVVNLWLPMISIPPYNFMLSRMSHSWKYTISSLLGLTSFVSKKNVGFIACCINQLFIPFITDNKNNKITLVPFFSFYVLFHLWTCLFFSSWGILKPKRIH